MVPIHTLASQYPRGLGAALIQDSRLPFRVLGMSLMSGNVQRLTATGNNRET